jgi:hypothetical protein|tara:strand:+ start:3951 stop:4370 length:420 start_codon:yes stop_codon:yes gene_type:complete
MGEDSFVGVMDIPVNPEIMSLATISIPKDVCLESISIPSNAISYITEVEFTFLLDGDEIWTGAGVPRGIEFSIPNNLAFSDKPRTLLVLVQPSALIGIPIGLNTSELPIALKGYRGVCAYNIDFSDDNEFESSFIENWL